MTCIWATFESAHRADGGLVSRGEAVSAFLEQLTELHAEDPRIGGATLRLDSGEAIRIDLAELQARAGRA